MLQDVSWYLNTRENEFLKSRLLEATHDSWQHSQTCMSHTPKPESFFQNCEVLKDYESSHRYSIQKRKLYCTFSTVKQHYSFVHFSCDAMALHPGNVLFQTIPKPINKNLENTTKGN